MKSRESRLALVILIILIAVGASVVSRRASFSRPRAKASGAQPSGGQIAQPTSHGFDFAYYSLRDGFDSTLFLVSDSPQPIDFTLAFHTLSGRPLVAPAMSIEPQAKLAVNLNNLLGRIAENPDDFAEGSLSVQYLGIGPMPLAGQVTVENRRLHLVYESPMVENDPGMMSDIPAVLNSAWWGLSAGRDATIAVSNTAGQAAEADVFLDFHGTRHAVGHHAGLRFRPHETEVLSVIRLLADLDLSPAQAPEGGITITPRGEVPTLIAHGHMLDPSTGFSTTLSFPEPGLQKGSALHASGVPIGTAPTDSPYAGAGSFIPHVIVRNLAASDQTVTLTIEYPGQTGPARTVLAPRSLAAYSTKDFSLDSVMDQLPLPLPFCSIRIQYSGTPGSAIAQVSSVEENRDLVIDGKLANEGDGSAGSGAYPWHLDAQTESILFLTNMGDRPSRIGFQVQASGVSYYLTKLKLSPHETRAIDLRKLRDAQEPDFQNNRIPANATDGSVRWAKFENVPVMGRMMVVQRHQGMASSYSCFSCLCGPVESFMSVSVTPTPVTGIPGDTQQFTCNERKEDCNNNPFFFDVTFSALWASSNIGIATVNTTGFGTAIDGGSVNITASFMDTEYYWDPLHGNCVESQTTRSNSASCFVQTPTFLLIGTSTCPLHSCPSGYNDVPERQIVYQVLDQNGNAIQRAGMSVSEWITNITGTCSGTPTGSTVNSDLYGTVTDHVWICCLPASNCGKSWNQDFTVNDYVVLVTTGLTGGITGAKNAVSGGCTNGVGSCPVVSPTP